LNRRLRYRAWEHHVERSIRLVAGALDVWPELRAAARGFKPEFHLEPGDVETADAIIPPADCLIAIQPGSGGETKLWNAEGWARVAAELVELGATVVLTGSSGEISFCQAVARETGVPISVLAGRTSLGSLAAILARCRLVIGVDSGALHLASA